MTIETGPGWEMRLGDCIEGMRAMADNSVDHFVTDPPFSGGLYEKHRTNGKRDRGNDERNVTKRRLASNSIGAIDEILDDAATEMIRLVRRWVLAFSDVEIGHRWRAAFGTNYIRAGAWVKTDPMPQISGDRPSMGFELITIAHRPGRKRWNGGGKPAVWTHGTCRGPLRPDHPCSKSLPLMCELIEDFTDSGDLVCDPFTGSGTTGVACRLLGRRFIGFELNRGYFDMACRRLRGDEVNPRNTQPSLFGAAL